MCPDATGNATNNNRHHALVRRVIKVGGSSIRRPADLTELGSYLRECTDRGEQVVVVHGGGKEVGAYHRALGVPFAKQGGLRVTTDESMPIVAMVLCGLVNKRVVAHLVGRGLKALGISGVDLGLLRAGFLNRSRLGRVGGPPRVDVKRLCTLLGWAWTPVVAPVCLGPDGQAVNVNADTLAHAMASELQVDSLEFVADFEGVRHGERVLRRLSSKEVERLISTSVIEARMLPKLQAALAALQSGVARVRVGDLDGMRADTATEMIL